MTKDAEPAPPRSVRGVMSVRLAPAGMAVLKEQAEALGVGQSAYLRALLAEALRSSEVLTAAAKRIKEGL